MWALEFLFVFGLQRRMGFDNGRGVEIVMAEFYFLLTLCKFCIKL